ncbi:tubulin glycylase 3A-like [Metopolophium dirhodum]|uniref:tubulin glycylase 3A-like n=1 Tax=Metopolophium dirhodum TaxID=44670 RepID=UPI00298F8D24|nr:tubulin glycylase 3A-like [Metopolophium dirhodum]
MNSNKNTSKRKTLTPRNNNKPLLNPKDKTKSYTLSTPNPIVTVEIPENTHNHISNTDLDNEVKQCSNTNNNTTNDKQDSSNQILELKEESQNSELSSFNTRYQLNSRNYIQELHKALIKECNYNLLDYTSLNATLDFESLTTVTSRTLNAVKDQKIFSVLGYFPTISLELNNRGWVEKRDPYRPPTNYSHYLKSAPYMVNWIESPPLISSISENEAIVERLRSAQSWNILKDKKSDYIFVTRKRLINWSNLSELTSVSQMTRHVFCTKNGLAQCLESYKNAVTNLMFPRCHYIRSEADSDAFVEDYITTALISTLKIIVKAIENNKKIFTTNGNIPYTIIDFVKRCVSKFLNKQITGSTEIDMWMFNSQKEVWNEFMIHYTKLIIDNNAKFDHEYTYELELDVYAKCKYLLENVKNYCPQHYIDGITNTWIIKPSSNCSGHGIMLSRDLHTIKRKITESGVLRNNYILQKYIERPLLVYTCKIDLRQWFLVTNMSPVVVWMYKEGYVRFCANSFSMQNMHESIHLSNVRLQMKYRKIRNPQVPDECMWDYRELQDHLRKIGQEYVWDELIFPGMGESVYAVLKAATDTSYYREKSFQLFGADFLITENFIPYLIEINSIPGLNPSTSIIANLAPMLLSDIVKVTVDYEKNSNADTGLFIKVVPEKWKTPAAVRRLGSVAAAINGGNSYNSPPVTVDRGGNIFNSTVAAAVQPAPFTTGYHNQWMDSVNKKLAALRLRINARKTPEDRGFICSKPHNT